MVKTRSQTRRSGGALNSGLSYYGRRRARPAIANNRPTRNAGGDECNRHREPDGEPHTIRVRASVRRKPKT